MELPAIFMVVALVAALCSAQPVVTSEPEQPHTSGHLRLKRQAPSIMNDSGECPKGQIKVKNFCMDEEKYWQEYDDSIPEQPHTSGVLRRKRQAPSIMNGSGECAKGQIKVKNFCMDKEKYWQEYDDSDPEEPHTSEVLRLKRQAPKPAIMNGGQSECAEGHTKAKGLCIPNEVRI